MVISFFSTFQKLSFWYTKPPYKKSDSDNSAFTSGECKVKSCDGNPFKFTTDDELWGICIGHTGLDVNFYYPGATLFLNNSRGDGVKFTQLMAAALQYLHNKNFFLDHLDPHHCWEIEAIFGAGSTRISLKYDHPLVTITRFGYLQQQTYRFTLTELTEVVNILYRYFSIYPLFSLPVSEETATSLFF